MGIELRRDPVTGRWVIISAARTQRPLDFPPPPALLSPVEPCPFCPGQEDRLPHELAAVRESGSAPDSPGWRHRAFRSVHPLFSPDLELERQGEGMFDMMTGYGEHEIVIDSPIHTPRLADLPVTEIRDLVLFWKSRVRELRKDERIRAVTICANRGEAAGARVDHVHSQVIGTPVLPRRLSDEISQSYAYFQRKERCVFCDIHESDAGGVRQVHANDFFTIFCPYASRFPYEMWVLPREHSSHFEEIDANRAGGLADALWTALKALEHAVGDPPSSFVIHSAPLRERGMVHFHWHLEIMPRLTQVAGFEWGTGFYINPTPPEEAAGALRQAFGG